jgi:uncharacterized protein with NAD-binding domain and iron-sulfur cluster
MITRRSLMKGGVAASVLATLPVSARISGRRIAILGGGVAGMTAAHELAERGFQVCLYERNPIGGGKARSMDVPGTGVGGRRHLPGEHGFRFIPGFYRHLPDTMSRIPVGPGWSVANNLVKTPEFSLSFAGRDDLRVPTDIFGSWSDIPGLLDAILRTATIGLSAKELEWFANRLQVFLTSCDARRLGQWENVSWWDYTRASTLSELARKLLVIGVTRNVVAVKAEQASTRSAALIMIQILMNALGMGGDLDRILNGPTNDVWIDPWVQHLRSLGVNYQLNSTVREIAMANGSISGARIETPTGTQWVEADAYIVALPVEVARRLLPRDALLFDPALAKLGNLNTEWMNGIQFYFDRDVSNVRGHANYLDSPWALTSISQAQFWPGFDLSQYGDGRVRGILSVDISNWTTPGVLFGKPAQSCTKEEIRQEVWAQLWMHFDDQTRAEFQQANLVTWHLDPGISFPTGSTVAVNDEPLLVNTVGSYKNRPGAVTRIPNLFLASDYVRTNTDLPCMEGANEAARRAVNGILAASGSLSLPCQLWDLSEPEIFLPDRANDKMRYALGLRNFYDVA